MKTTITFLFITAFMANMIFGQSNTGDAVKPFAPPVSFEEAGKRADTYLEKLTLKEKIKFINGLHFFYIRGFKKHNIPRLYLSDASQGVHLRNIIKSSLKKSVAFPCPLALASTWNTELAGRYARCTGKSAARVILHFFLVRG